MMVESLDIVHKLLVQYSRSAALFATLQRARYSDEKVAAEIAQGTSYGTQMLRAISEALRIVREVNPALLRELQKRTVASKLDEIAGEHNDLELTARRLREAVQDVFPLINEGEKQQSKDVYETILQRISKLKEVSSYMVL